MRILVVEDEPHLLRLITEALREAGFAVDTAADGESGLQEVLQHNYSVIVLDVMLPRISGLDVLKRLRQTQDTPVVIVSARDTPEERVAALDAGADDYLVKPFDLQELIARVRALVRRSTGNVKPVIAIDDITIDTRTRTVVRGDNPVPLTPREYGLLELFALNRGTLVTREQINDRLFDETELNVSNLIDVHMSNLRRKLGRDVITTRRGQGYIVDE